MKVGDLVKVRDPLREDVFGQHGIIVKERYDKYYVKVHFLIIGQTRGMYFGDLEVISESKKVLNKK